MTRIVLWQDHVTDLSSSIQRAKNAGYNSVICNIVNTQFQKEFEDEPMRSKHISFTRSDLILKSQDWIGLILKFSDSIQCDSKDENIRRISEKTFLLENNLAEHLVNILNETILFSNKTKKKFITGTIWFLHYEIRFWRLC